jgi:hypothetical protein
MLQNCADTIGPDSRANLVKGRSLIPPLQMGGTGLYSVWSQSGFLDNELQLGLMSPTSEWSTIVTICSALATMGWATTVSLLNVGRGLLTTDLSSVIVRLALGVFLILILAMWRLTGRAPGAEADMFSMIWLRSRLRNRRQAIHGIGGGEDFPNRKTTVRLRVRSDLSGSWRQTLRQRKVSQHQLGRTCYSIVAMPRLLPSSFHEYVVMVA